MTKKLLIPPEVDRLFRYPRGRSQRLAKRNQIPHITLPDGEIRFDPEVINQILAGDSNEATFGQGEVAHA